MKCLVNRVAELATAKIKGPVKSPAKLNETQQRVRDVFRTLDFGCNTEQVATILEALTGHKPVKGPGTKLEMFDVGQLDNSTALRFVVIGLDGGYSYGFCVDNPKGGHVSINGNALKQLDDKAKSAIVEKFLEVDDAVLVNFLCQNMGGQFPQKFMKALD